MCPLLFQQEFTNVQCLANNQHIIIKNNNQTMRIFRRKLQLHNCLPSSSVMVTVAIKGVPNESSSGSAVN